MEVFRWKSDYLANQIQAFGSDLHFFRIRIAFVFTSLLK